MPSSRVRHLSKAPIKEALIDIRVSPREGVTLESFNELVELAKIEYPIEKKSKFFEVTFDMALEVTRSTEPVERGFVLMNSQETQVVQFRLDGFTVNRLKEYDTWKSLFSEAMKWWHLYESQVGPSQITRLGVKFINRILLPDADFPVYLTRPPARPLGMKGKLSNFFYQTQIESDFGITAAVTQWTERTLDDGKIPFLFDIDVSIPVVTPLQKGEMNDKFEQLHQAKNDIFFDSLTKETLRL